MRTGTASGDGTTLPHLDWRRIAGLRDVLAHAYFALDDETLRDIVETKIPELLAEVRQLRQSS